MPTAGQRAPSEPGAGSTQRRSIEAWLDRQAALHPTAIDLGLERCRRVGERLQLDAAAPLRIVVAGTNGKGSCVAFLEAMLTAAGLRTGTYTSPHLVTYNERVKIGTQAVSDATLIAAFERVDRVRGDVSLTAFEFGTLAAADIIERARVDVAVMEVGLGGRLDAVNIFEPDVSLITAIDIDHQQWLGGDRESVGREKAGIMRPGIPCVIGDPAPPDSILDHARAIGTPCRILGRHYGYTRGSQCRRWWGSGRTIDDLPAPGLPGDHQIDNAAACLAVLDALSSRIRVDDAAMRHGIAEARIAGRLQWLDAPARVLVDVAHNPLGATVLAAYLATRRPRPRRRAVCGILIDKDAGAMLPTLISEIDAWYLASLPGDRGRDAPALARELPDAATRLRFDSVDAAFAAALADRDDGEEIVVFGSFVTVGAVLRFAAAQVSSTN